MKTKGFMGAPARKTGSHLAAPPAARIDFDKFRGMPQLKKLQIMHPRVAVAGTHQSGRPSGVGAGVLRFIEFALTLRYPERKRSAQIRYP